MALPVEINPLQLTSSASYTVGRSLRFRSSASAYLNRTFATSGTSRQTSTFSFWLKRGVLSTSQRILDVYDGSSPASTALYFNSNDTLQMDFGGAAQYSLITTQVFRDPSAWYHFVITFDTTNATAANRVKIYVNGVQITSFSTANYPPQNANSFWFISSASTKMMAQWNTSTFVDGYLAEVNFIDGQALTPSSFGANDVNGVWQPKKYTGTYGTNGFYLNFSDNSAATAAAIGADRSGNGNNWTPNNISLTAGTTYDSMIDSPTPYADGGNGRGNYAVLNPVGKSGGTITDGNLQWASGGVDGAQATASIALLPNTGKFYCEILIGSKTTIYWIVGLVESRAVAWSGTAVVYYGQSPYQSIAQGDVIGITVDTSNGAYQFYKNGSSTSMPSGTITLTGQPIYFGAVEDSSGGTANYTFNFGQRPFTYTPPTGFKALNTYNLPAPTILAGNAHFDATTYTGTNTTKTVTNSGSFQPDLLWIKDRTNAYAANIQDVIRGSHQVLIPSLSNAEASSSTPNGVTSFNSNGFSLGLDTNTTGSVNALNDAYVAWQWKGGGAGVSNTAGSITSTVSANTTAGCSIVTYTGTGAAATVGHGLGVAPSMIIVKCRNFSIDWIVYHASIGNNAFLTLDTTAAQVTGASYMWNSTSPTSSVFSVNTDAGANGSTRPYVAYCFAAVRGFSAFGSYTGNGSADGPFIYTGFRPRFLLVKNVSAAGDPWYMIDTSIALYNVTANLIQGNSSAAELTGRSDFDFLSNGFKNRATFTGSNSNGATYIYAAFAENPFNSSRAR